jgi:hypothetical protein
MPLSSAPFLPAEQSPRIIMANPRPSTADKRKAYRALHETGCFVLPNPWDIGSARYLQHVGFKAVASTSAG